MKGNLTKNSISNAFHAHYFQQSGSATKEIKPEKFLQLKLRALL